MTTAQIELPPKLIPVFEGEADVRGAFGGRGSGKTRSFAKMTAVRAYMWDKAGRSGQIVCGRQFMNSLADSSLEEIKLAILEEPWLAAEFEIGEKYITLCDVAWNARFQRLHVGQHSRDAYRSSSRWRVSGRISKGAFERSR